MAGQVLDSTHQQNELYVMMCKYIVISIMSTSATLDGIRAGEAAAFSLDTSLRYI